jgi:hypothetical protein
MRVIGPIQGISAMRAFPEDYMPPKPPSLRDLLVAITSRYQFAAFPQPGAAATAAVRGGGTLEFLGGKFPDPEEGFSIARLIMALEGDVAIASSTDQSDLVLGDVGSFLDERFSFRLTASRKPVVHISIIVVELEDSFEDLIQPLATIETIINKSIHSPASRKFRKFGFGSEQGWEMLGETQQVSIDMIEKMEFSIERRVNYPFSTNRYYCVAPMSTPDHIECLNEIESAIRR